MVNDNDNSGVDNYLTKTIREDGKLVPIDDPDVKTYSYALYNCEYCHVKVFLSLETKAIFNTPNNSKAGIILALWNKPKRGRPKKGKRYSAVTKKAVCWNCFKAI